DGVAVRRACEAGAERAGAAVRSAGDGAGVRLYGDCCGEKERRGNKRRRASTGRAVKGGFKRGKSFHLTKPMRKKADQNGHLFCFCRGTLIKMRAIRLAWLLPRNLTLPKFSARGVRVMGMRQPA